MPKNTISDILNNLTKSPGVYKFLDDSDNVIYIGKAKNLRNRVRSYFTGKKSDEKTRSLVTNIKDISIILVETELRIRIKITNFTHLVSVTFLPPSFISKFLLKLDSEK